MTEQPDEAVFSPDGDRWMPSPIAVGPWDPGSLHGGPPTALVGRVLLDHEPGDTQWFLSRLTVELIRPVPLAPLKVDVTMRRPGRRVQLLDAVITAPDGTRSEEHTSELQSLMRISYAVFCLQKKKRNRYHI